MLKTPTQDVALPIDSYRSQELKPSYKRNQRLGIEALSVVKQSVDYTMCPHMRPRGEDQVEIENCNDCELHLQSVENKVKIQKIIYRPRDPSQLRNTKFGSEHSPEIEQLTKPNLFTQQKVLYDGDRTKLLTP